MVQPKKTWREKRLAAREENSTDSDDSRVEPEGNEEGAGRGDNDKQRVDTMFEVNMVFVLPEELKAPKTEVAHLTLWSERAVFKKPVRLGEHMKFLYIKGHLDGAQVGRMMVHGGASVSIVLLFFFAKLGQKESDLKQKNMSVGGFFWRTGGS
jgi:hypothetical protein